jgi:hypothetical protein
VVDGLEVRMEGEEQQEEEMIGVEGEETCCWDESVCNCKGDWISCLFVYLGRGAEEEIGEGKEEDEIPVIQEEEVIGEVREEELCNRDRSICRCETCRGQRGVMSMPTSGLRRVLLEIPIVVDRASDYVIEYGIGDRHMGLGIEYGIGDRVVREEEVVGDQLGAVGGGEEEELEELEELKEIKEELRGLRNILETGHFGFRISTAGCEEGAMQHGDLRDSGIGSLRQEGAEEEEVEHLTRYEEEEEQGEEVEEEEEGISDYEEDQEERPEYEGYEAEGEEVLLSYEVGEGEEELPGYEECEDEEREELPGYVMEEGEEELSEHEEYEGGEGREEEPEGGRRVRMNNCRCM